MWFKIDDKFPRHRKARAARRGHPTKRRDVSAIGLWALAGAESDDGFIALEQLLDFDDDAEILARRLVDAGLWREGEIDDEPGFWFHDWAIYNPADPSSSGTFGNHVRWHQKRGKVDPDCVHCEAVSSGRIAPDDRGDDRVDIAPESLTRPDPTRPDPTRSNNSRSRSSDTEAAIVDRFEDFWATYDHKVGRAKAMRAYRAALKKPGVTESLLIAAAESYIAFQKREGSHPKFTKHPTTWLHGEHWRDERTERPAPPTRVQQHLQLAADLAAEEQQVIPFRQIGDGR